MASMVKGLNSFKQFLFLALLTLVASARSFSAPPPAIIFPGCNGAPANDLFANAQLLTGDDISVSGFTRCASVEAGEVARGTSSVWYRWTSPRTARVTADLTVFQGTTGPILIPGPPISNLDFFIGGTLDSLTNVTQLPGAATNSGTFVAIRGQEYFIRVDTGGSQFTLRLSLDGLKYIGPTASPLAGQSQVFEIAAADPAETLVEATALVDGISIGTRTNAPFSFETSSPTNGFRLVTAVGKNASGDILKLAPQSISFRPTNDNFSAAITLPSLLVGQPQQGSSLASTLEANEVAHPPNIVEVPTVSGPATLSVSPSGSVWWKWVASQTTPCVLYVPVGSVAIYKGTNLTSLTLVTNVTSQARQLVIHAWDSPGANATSFSTTSIGPTFTAVQGETYWIAELSGGSFFYWSIYQHPHTLEFDNSRAGIPTHFFLRGQNDAPEPESVTLTIQSPNGETTFATTSIPFPQPDLWTWVPPASGSYRVTFAIKYPNAGVWQENYVLTALPANDDFANASVIPSETNSTSIPFNAALAGLEALEPDSATNGPGLRTLWWKWTPSAAAHVRISAPSSNGGLWVDVFRGTTLSNVTRVANNDAFANHPPFSGFAPLFVEAGQTYHIRVATLDGVSYSAGNLIVEPYDGPARGFILLSTASGEPLSDGSIHWNVFGRLLDETGAPATNRLYSAQFFVGTNLSALKPYWYPSVVLGPFVNPTVELAGVANQGLAYFPEYNAGTTVLLQLRAWDINAGPYEQARTANALTARSAIMSVQVGGELGGPTLLTNIGNLTLAKEADGFRSARIEVDHADTNLRLTGSPGLYSIEASNLSQAWTNVLILTNATGATPFNITPTNAVTILRSRLLD